MDRLTEQMVMSVAAATFLHMPVLWRSMMKFRYMAARRLPVVVLKFLLFILAI